MGIRCAPEVVEGSILDFSEERVAAVDDVRNGGWRGGRLWTQHYLAVCTSDTAHRRQHRDREAQPGRAVP